MSDQNILIETISPTSASSADKAMLMAKFRDLKAKLEAADKQDFSLLSLPIEYETLDEKSQKKLVAEKIAENINELLEVQYALQSDQAAGPKGRKTATKATTKKPSSSNEIKIVADNNLLDDL